MIILYTTKDGFNTLVQQSYQAAGGGEGVTTNGGIWHGCPGNECQWHPVNDVTPIPKPDSYGENKTFAHCETTLNNRCQIVTISWSGEKKYMFPLPDSISAKTKVSCVGGLETTQVDTFSMYSPATAEAVCAKSENTKQLELVFAGTKDKIFFSCGIPHEVASFMPGNGVPLTIKSASYKPFDPCTTQDSQAYYFAETTSDFCAYNSLAAAPAKCEEIFIFSTTGKFVFGSNPPKEFQKAEFTNLSTTMSVSCKTRQTNFGIKDTDITFMNGAITLNKFSKQQNKYTSYYYYNINDKISSVSFSFLNGPRTSLGETQEVLPSDGITGEITKTQKFEYQICNSSVTDINTITLLAGTTLTKENPFLTTVQLGDFIALEVTKTERTYALAFDQFDFSTSLYSSGSSKTTGTVEYACNKPVPDKTKICQGEPYTLQTFAYKFEPGPATGITCYEVPGPTYVGYTLPVPFAGIDVIDIKCAASCSSTVEISNLTKASNNESKVTCQGPPILTCETFASIMQYPSQVIGTGTEMRMDTYRCDEPQPDETITQVGNGTTQCSQQLYFSYRQQITRPVVEKTITHAFQNSIFKSYEHETGILYEGTDGKLSFGSTFEIKQKGAFLDSSQVGFAFDGATYSPFGGKTKLFSSGGKTTFIALATGPDTRDGKSHNGEIHSFLVSDQNGYSNKWEQASWPGYGVFRGNISTETFSISFKSPKRMTLAEWGESAGVIFQPKHKAAKFTIFADGGLNLISSKNSPSESWKTSTNSAFSTSFDSSFSGAYIVKNTPFYSATTVSEARLLQLGETPPFLTCDSCGGGGSNNNWNIFPNQRILSNSISKEYFIKGDMSKIYLHNKNSYLWTNPASKFVWGTGHGRGCG